MFFFTPDLLSEEQGLRAFSPPITQIFTDWVSGEQAKVGSLEDFTPRIMQICTD
ncbi:MAG: hypothetical protein H6555_09670 [Lewinellaceae bacterium]|nr:hypothetical protein [Lewinellaceae bacterium]